MTREIRVLNYLREPCRDGDLDIRDTWVDPKFNGDR